jgi:hypothetical protein
MNTIFVVTQCEYDYEDSSQVPILVTPYQPIADNKVAEMIARQEARNKAYEDICQHMKDWEVANPRPRNVLDKKKKESTFSEDFAKWIPIRHEEQKRFTTSLPQQIQEDLHLISERSVWEVEIVPYAEQ